MATEQGRGPIYNPDYGKELTELPQLLEGPSLSAELYAVQDGISVSTTLGDLLALPLFRNAYLYTSRADAVGGVPLLLPTVQAVFVLEGGMLVVRERNSTAEDPLFPSGWGVTYRSISQADVDLVIAAAAQAVQAAQDAQDAAASAGAYAPYQTRAAAEAATVPTAVNRILVMSDVGSLAYVSDAQGTALTTADGRTWSPDGDATPEHWGDVGSGDWTDIITRAGVWCAQNKRKLKTGSRVYNVTQVSIRANQESAFLWDCDNTVFQCITATAIPSNHCLLFSPGTRSEIMTVTAPIMAGSDIITVNSTSSLSVGDLVEIRLTALINTDHRGNARRGQLCKVSEVINGTTFRIADTAQEDYIPYTYEGAVVSPGTTSVTLPSNIDRQQDAMRMRMTMTSGALSGQTNPITGWDNTTKLARFGQGLSATPWPSGMQAGDTFRLDTIVTVASHPSAKCVVNGRLDIRRPLTTNAAAGDIGFIGFHLFAMDEPCVENVHISGFSDTAFRVDACYKGNVRDGSAVGANRAYASQGNSSDGTGYGISDHGSYGVQYVRMRTQGCRRGFDAIGSQMPSWHAKTIDCTFEGGGIAYGGESFFPNGPHYNSGMGSHGGGYFTVYQGCRVTDCRNAINSRGKRNSARDTSITGYSYQPVLFSFVDGLEIVGLTYDFGGSWTNYIDSNPVIDTTAKTGSTANDVSKFPVAFASGLTDSINANGPIIFDGIRINGLNGPFLSISRGGRLPYAVFGSVTVRFVQSLDQPIRAIFVDRPDGDTSTVGSVRFTSPPVLLPISGAGSSMPDGRILSTLVASGLIPLNTPVCRDWDNSFLVKIANDTVYQHLLGNAASSMVVDVISQDAEFYFGQSMILGAGSATDRSPLQASNKTGLDISASVLTGTTGASGRMTLAYRPSGGGPYLRIENRRGGERTVMVKLNQFGLVT